MRFFEPFAFDVKAMVTWASGLVPFGLSLSGVDMSLVIMRLGIVSEEAVRLDGSESLAMGTSDPLGLFWATGLATVTAYIAPPPGSPSCWLQTAAC